MQWGRAYSYFRDDPEWGSKFFMACLAMLSAMIIPVLGQIVLLGWLAMLFRQIVGNKDDRTLPPIGFNNVGELLNSGVKPFIVQLLYSMPLIFGIMIGYFVMIFGMIGGMGLMGAGAAAAGRHNQGGAAAGVLGGSVLMLVCFLVFYVLIMVLVIAVQILSYGAVTRAELADDIGAGLKWAPVAKYAKMMWWDIFVTMFIGNLINMPLMMLGMLLLCVGMFPAAVVMMLAQTHLRAQLYQKYLDKGGEPFPTKVPPPAPATAALPPQSF